MAHKLKQPELQPSASMNGDDSKILCLGGRGKSSVMEVFSIAGKINSCYPDLPTTLRWHCVEKVDDFVYCMGGETGDGMGHGTERVYRMNLKDRNKTWSMIAGMSERRCLHASAVFKGNIVVSGGRIPFPLSSSEMYHINGNKWTSLKPMNEKRSCHSMVVCNDTLYALGGFDQRSVEKLEDVEGNWTVGQPMNVPRCHLATVCLNGEIYAIGGISKQSGQYKAQKSVEKFVPKESRWSYVSSMNTAREQHAACVLRGKIYVVGGEDEDGNSVSTIECYDPDKDTWSIAADNICELYEHAVVAI